MAIRDPELHREWMHLAKDETARIGGPLQTKKEDGKDKSQKRG